MRVGEDKMSADKNTLFSHDNNELSRNWSRMARKNFLASLVDVDVPLEQEPTSYPMRGASKTMIRSIDEMAEQGDRYLEGEAIVELEPGQVDGSFISDRLDDDQTEFEALVEATKAQGCQYRGSLSGRFQSPAPKGRQSTIARCGQSSKTSVVTGLLTAR